MAEELRKLRNEELPGVCSHPRLWGGWHPKDNDIGWACNTWET